LSRTRSFTFFLAVAAGLAAFFPLAIGALAFRLFALGAAAFCALGAGFAGFDFAIVLCSGNSDSINCEKRGKGTTCSAPSVQGESLGKRLYSPPLTLSGFRPEASGGIRAFAANLDEI
jgi:hypothetical protein